MSPEVISGENNNFCGETEALSSAEGVRGIFVIHGEECYISRTTKINSPLWQSDESAANSAY